MPCNVHPDTASFAECSNCGQGLCRDCLYYANSEPYCGSCLAELEKEFAQEKKTQTTRSLLAGVVGVALAVTTVLGWQWILFRTKFGAALFTPFLMYLMVIVLALVMARVSRSQSHLVFGTGAVLALGMMLGGEYLTYQYTVFREGQKGLSAEKLFRFTETFSFADHLEQLGPFDYCFILLAVLWTWRRLWPSRPGELAIIRPVVAE